MSGTEVCKVCRETIPGKAISASENMKYHADCFLCHECLRPFPSGNFFTADDKKLLCEEDYYRLYGDRCAKCGELIMERLITALDMKWHADHFVCDECSKPLAGSSYMKRNDRPFCKECFAKLKAFDAGFNKNTCERCKKPIMANEEELMVEGLRYHAYHHTCTQCKKQLTSDYKQHDGKLYCPADYAKVIAPLCYVCRKPIYGRVITAIGKQFHPEHFVCTKCEQPFTNSTFHEHQGKPYCEAHFNELAGSKCYRCHKFAQGKVVAGPSGRKYCADHFSCYGCDINLAKDNQKFYEWDTKTMCSRCFDMIPSDIRKHLKKYADIEIELAKAAAKKKK